MHSMILEYFVILNKWISENTVLKISEMRCIAFIKDDV